MEETLLRMAVMDQPIKPESPFPFTSTCPVCSDTKQHQLRRDEVRLPRIPDKFLLSLAYSFEWFLKNWPFCWGIFWNSRMSYWSMPVESLWTPFFPPQLYKSTSTLEQKKQRGIVFPFLWNIQSPFSLIQWSKEISMYRWNWMLFVFSL